MCAYTVVHSPLKVSGTDENPPLRYHNQKRKRNLTGEVSDITTESLAISLRASAWI